MNPQKLFIFGYGSLIWKVDFPFVDKIPGYIKGFQRRFYQYSIDHRGTLEKPGHVVTLIPSEDNDSKVFGVAYEISECDKLAVMSHLDFREKNGYQKFNVQFYPMERQRENSPISLIVYVATEENESFAGPKDIPEIAEQVLDSCGPSGKNIDYVYNLAAATRELFPGEEDHHLFALEKALKELEKNQC